MNRVRKISINNDIINIEYDNNTSVNNILEKKIINKKNGKIDFEDYTILIPFHCDTEDRLENVNIVIKYLLQHVNCTIYLKEMGKVRTFNNEKYLKLNNFRYEFWRNKFSKTKLLNSMVYNINTKYFIMNDTDILPTKLQLENIYKFNSNGLCDAIIPYNGLYLEVNKSKCDLSNLKDSIDLTDKCNYRFEIEDYIGTGAIVAFKKKSFLDAGGMNEKFQKWGYEDDEILYRLFNLGYNVARLNNAGPIFHISHEYIQDDFGGNQHNHDLSEIQKKEYDRVKLLMYSDLRREFYKGK